MSVHAVSKGQEAEQAQAVTEAKAQATQKQANQPSAPPQDKVTISAAAQAKQAVSALGIGTNKQNK